MSLTDDVRALADRTLDRLDEARDFYLHTRQAWRIVQQIAHEGHSVGIVETVGGQDVPATDLAALAQRYVTIHRSESTFKGLSGLLADWMIGLARPWLTAYPIQLIAASIEAPERPRSQRREEIQIPLSEILDAVDRDSILGVVIERVLRDLAQQRPALWFRFLEHRVNLGCPDETQRNALCEMKAARDVLEHNRGQISEDYRAKAGSSARYAVGETIQIEEPYLLQCFDLPREVIKAMAAAAVRKSSPPTRPNAQVES